MGHGGSLGLIIVGYGKNSRERPRMEYMPQIVKDRGCDSYGETKIKASNGKGRRIATNRSQS